LHNFVFFSRFSILSVTPDTTFYFRFTRCFCEMFEKCNYFEFLVDDATSTAMMKFLIMAVF